MYFCVKCLWSSGSGSEMILWYDMKWNMIWNIHNISVSPQGEFFIFSPFMGLILSLITYMVFVHEKYSRSSDKLLRWILHVKIKFYVVFSSNKLENGIIIYKASLCIITEASHKCARRTINKEISILGTLLLCYVI